MLAQFTWLVTDTLTANPLQQQRQVVT